MKVLIYSHRKYACGASVAAARLAIALKESGHKVIFAHNIPQRRKCPLDTKGVVVADLGRYRTWRSPIKPLLERSGRFFQHDFSGAVLSRRLLYLIDSFQPDIINIHNNFFSADLLRSISGHWPLAWTMHDCYAADQYHYKIKTFQGNEMIFREMPEWTTDPRGPERLKAFPGSFHLLSPSKWLADHTDEVLEKTVPVDVVPNVLPERDFKPRDKQRSRTKLGLSQNKFYVLFLAGKGAWQRKNFEVLKEALQRAPKLDIQVLLRGGVPDEITFDDPRIVPVAETWSMTELSELYSAADVFCISSVLDNLPNTILESLACGTPVVGSNVGGIPEMVSEEKNTGWLFDPYDPASLARALSRARVSTMSREDRVQACRDFIWRNYRRKVAVDRHVALFQKMISEQQAIIAANGKPVDPPSVNTVVSKFVFQPVDTVVIGSHQLVRKTLSRMRDSHTYPYKSCQPSLATKVYRTQCYKSAAAGSPLRSNERRILDYKDAYKGRRMFIIGNGPSLNKLDLSLLKNELTIGVNSIFLAREKLGGLPTHYVVEDLFVAEDRADQINDLRGTQKWFGNYLRHCLNPDPDTLWLNVRMRYDNYKNFPYFSKDACRQVWTGGSVTYICMQLAYYFGIEEAYLIGFDHHYDIPKSAIVKGLEIVSTADDPNHFDPTYFGKGYRWHDPMVDRMEKGYKKAARAFRERGGFMKNATAGGKLECLPRVSYESLFPAPRIIRLDESERRTGSTG